MAKTLKKRVQRLEAQVESLTKKVRALGRTAAKKISKRRAKVTASVIGKVKPAVVEPATLNNPDESSPLSGAA